MSYKFWASDGAGFYTEAEKERYEKRLIQNKMDQMNTRFSQVSQEIQQLERENQNLSQTIKNQNQKMQGMSQEMQTMQSNQKRIEEKHEALRREQAMFEKEITQTVQIMEENLGQQIEELDAEFAQKLSNTRQQLQSEINKVDAARQRDKELLTQEINRVDQEIQDYKDAQSAKTTSILDKASIIADQAEEILDNMNPVDIKKTDLEEDHMAIKQRLSRIRAHQEAEQTALGSAEELFNKTLDLQRDLNGRVALIKSTRENLKDSLNTIRAILDDTLVKKYYTLELEGLMFELDQSQAKINNIQEYRHLSADQRLLEQRLESLINTAQNIRVEAPLTDERYRQRVERVDSYLVSLANQSWSGSGDYGELTANYQLKGDLKSDWIVKTKISGCDVEIKMPLDPQKEFQLHIDNGDPATCEQIARLVSQSQDFQVRNSNASQTGFASDSESVTPEIRNRQINYQSKPLHERFYQKS